MLGWNVGGADLPDVPKAVRDSVWRSVKKEELVLLQEVPRTKQGWSYSELAGKRLVTHQSAQQWRGTGLWYDGSVWCLVRKIGTAKGTWFKLRHLEGLWELWLGTSHFTPGVPAEGYETEVHDHFAGLPRTAHRVVYQGDVNTGFAWVPEGDGVSAVVKEGKGNILHKVMVEAGFTMGVPDVSQLHTPTSRPRQAERRGQCIDVMAFRNLRFDSWKVHVDSYLSLGTDHELCESCFAVKVQREHIRHETRPRTWTGGVTQIDGLDQDGLEVLAKQCTRPTPGHGYRDPVEVKRAFKQARSVGTPAMWKSALKMRKEARKSWEHDRLIRASQGEWHSFRALKPRRHEGWDVGFAEAQTGDPYQAVHDHLVGVYSGTEVGEVVPWTGEIHAFSLEELRVALAQLKRGKAVGADLTSTELLQGLVEVKGGESHLLEWFNRILATQRIPRQWNEPVMVMLPKIRAPKAAKDLRPIAMGSAVSKLFSCLLLNRALPMLMPQTHAQCSGKGRQTSDFLFTLIRLFDLSREWGSPLVIFKLDLEKAFDSLDRGKLLERLELKLGSGAELNCWKGLLKDVTGLLQTPWGSSRVPMMRGIKQGGVESPVFFAHIAELVLAETIDTYSWRSMPPLFPDLPPEEMMYMDDGLVWNSRVEVVQLRAQQLSVEFAKYGLKLNPRKCQLYVSPNTPGHHRILLNGVRVEAVEQLQVMGLSLRVGISVYELIAPAASRARAKFWELRHIFRAKGNMRQRSRVMQRVVGATAYGSFVRFRRTRRR